MPEPEDQLRRLAEHRASKVPAYDVSALATRRRRRTPVLIGAIAAAVVLAIVATAFAFWPDDDSRSVHVIAPSTSEAPSTVPTTTSPLTTTTSPLSLVPTCAQGGASLDAQGATSSSPEPPMLFDVRVQASACLDVVTLVVNSAAVPQWTATYEDGPFFDEAGHPVSIAGGAHLVLRLDPATADQRAMFSEIGGDTKPIAPSAIRETRAFRGSDGAMQIVIGLDRRQPFVARTEPDLGLVVELPAFAPRDTTCTSPADGFQIATPSGWFVDMARPCHMFSPAPFRLYQDSNWQLVGAGFANYDPLDNPSTVIVSDRREVVNGHDARAVEVEWTNNSGLGVSIGTRDYYWIVDVGGRPFVVGVLRGPGAEYDAKKVGADELVRSLRFP
jgi:hypothetical protein